MNLTQDIDNVDDELQKLNAHAQTYREYIQHIETQQSQLRDKRVQLLLKMEEYIWTSEYKDPSLQPWEQILDADEGRTNNRALSSIASIAGVPLLQSTGYNIHTDQHAVRVSFTDYENWNKRLYPFIEEVLLHLKGVTDEHRNLPPMISTYIGDTQYYLFQLPDKRWSFTTRYYLNRLYNVSTLLNDREQQKHIFLTLDEMVKHLVQPLMVENKKTYCQSLLDREQYIRDTYAKLTGASPCTNVDEDPALR